MGAMEADSVDAIVTDPPYGLAFMGKGWDHAVPGVEFWSAALRVAKPGTYLLAFGGTRTFHRLAVAIEDAGWEIHDCLTWLYGSGFPKHKSKLKPAWEPIILARKPAKRATLLNIEQCRIEAERPTGWAGVPTGWAAGGLDSREPGGRPVTGRYPANVVLDEDAAAMLDAQSGASRFFYCAKASRAEREAGLEGMPRRVAGVGNVDEQSGRDSSLPSNQYRTDSRQRVARGETPTIPRANHHPTVKPIALMRWLVRLVAPEGGLVLDPFAGSGSTGCAAVLEGRQFIGAELDADYAAIARARIAHWAKRA